MAGAAVDCSRQLPENPLSDCFLILVLVYFYPINVVVGVIKAILILLDGFYWLRDAEHCQSYFQRSSIPRSQIGDVLPGVNLLFLTESTELH